MLWRAGDYTFKACIDPAGGTGVLPDGQVTQTVTLHDVKLTGMNVSDDANARNKLSVTASGTPGD